MSYGWAPERWASRSSLRYLDVPLDELWRRLAQRNDSPEWGTAPISRDLLESYLRFWDPPQQTELALFDAPLPIE